MCTSSNFLVFTIMALAMSLRTHARPIGNRPPPETPDKPPRRDGPVQPFAFLRTFQEYNSLNKTYNATTPPLSAAPVAPFNLQTILDGPVNQVDYPDAPDAPDYEEYEAPDAPDGPDYEEYEEPDAPDTPEYGANESPGVFSEGGFGFLGGNGAPFMMTGGKAPSAMGKGVMNEYQKGSSSGSSVGIAFAVLAIIGCTVALGVFFFKKYRHHIPVIVLK